MERERVEFNGTVSSAARKKAVGGTRRLGSTGSTAKG
jgi:hypothetical protein